MKKVLSFVLVLAMILGSVSMVFAEAHQSDLKLTTSANAGSKWDDMSFTDAPENGIATYLKLLGVLEGYEDGTVKAENELTRAEAATLVVRAMGQDALGKVQVKTAFKDVPATHWASGYVALANEAGYVDGVGNGYFDPDAKLTVDQAIAMILKVLGYENKYVGGTWPANYRMQASKVQILTKVTVGSQNATRQDFFQLIDNALGKNIVKWDKEDERFYAINNEGQGQYQTLLDQVKTLRTGNYKDVNLVEGKTVNSQDIANKVPAKYFGKNVTFLKYGASLAGIYKVNSKTVEGNFEDDYNGTFATFAGLKANTLKKDNTLFIVNGTSMLKQSEAASKCITIAEAFTSKAAVTAEVIYNIDGVATDIVSFSTWHKDATVKVTSAEAALLAAENYKKIYNSTDWLGDIAVKYTAATKTYALDATNPVIVEGAVDKLSDIKENDVVELYYYAGNDIDGKIAKAVVTRDVVTGTMSDYSNRKGTVTVNGQAYSLALTEVNPDGIFNYENLEKALNVTSYSLYLDSEGKVAFIEYTTEKVEAPKARLAFVLGFGTETAYTEKTVVAGSVFNVVTDAYIRLLPFDTMVEEDYHLVSTAATDLKAFFDEDGKWTEDVETGLAIAFTAKDNKLASLATKTDLKEVTATKINANGFVAASNFVYAKDAKAYIMPSDEAKLTKAAYYASKAAKDLATDYANATNTNLLYALDKSGLVTTIVVESVVAEPAGKFITAAALYDLAGTRLEYTPVGEAEAKLTVTGVALKAEISECVPWVLYKIDYADGVVTNVTPLDYDDEAVVDAEELTYSDNVIKEGTTVKVRVLSNVKFMIEDAKGYLENVAADDVAEALAKATELDCYKAFNDYFYDVVVIRTAEFE